MPTWCHNQVYVQGRCSSHHNSIQKRRISKSEKSTSPFPHFSQKRAFIDWGFCYPSGSWPLNTNFSDWYRTVAKPNLVSALFDSNLHHSRAHKIDHKYSHCELFPKFPTHHTELLSSLYPSREEKSISGAKYRVITSA